MGAMFWQVVQVKRKNSTSTGLPSPTLTVAGSLASSLSPREVATPAGAGATVSAAGGVTVATASTAVGLTVAAGAIRVGMGAAGAQAASANTIINNGNNLDINLIMLLVYRSIGNIFW